MMNKKLASLLAVGALVTALGTTSAFAVTPATSIPYCTVSGCTVTGNHQHDGVTYAAHTIGDGHTYHTNCGISGCTITGDHTYHNGGHRSHSYGGHHR